MKHISEKETITATTSTKINAFWRLTFTIKQNVMCVIGQADLHILHKYTDDFRSVNCTRKNKLPTIIR